MNALRHVLVLAVLAGLVAAALGVSLGGGFVWDDRPLIVENSKVRDPSRVHELVTSSFWHTGDRHDRFRRFYRPVTAMSYAADHALWKLRPLGYHLTNLLAHLGCCLLVYAIARREALPAAAALAGAGLFAVHPVHVESVAWISGRTDVLSTALVLGAFLLLRDVAPPGRVPWRAGAGWCLFGLALLAKEVAATLPALLVLDSLLLGGGPRSARLRRGLARAAPLIAVLAAVLVLRRVVLGAGMPGALGLDLVSHLATAVFVLARYATLLILPVRLDAHYPDPPVESLASAPFLVGTLLLAIVSWGFWLLLRRDRQSAFWLAWIFVTLTPVLGFGTFGDVLLADRFLYLPSVGLAMLLARGVTLTVAVLRGPRGRFAVAAAMTVLLLVTAAASHRRATVWQDDLTLFRDMIRSSPDSALVRCNLGIALYHTGALEEAEIEFRRAVELVPSFALAHNNLAAALERRGALRDALAHYRRALELAPMQIEARINVGRLQVFTGRVDEGLEALSSIARQHPTFVPALTALAASLDEAGRPGEALPHALRARELEPDRPDAHYLIGRILFMKGRREEAARSMQRFLELWQTDDAYRRAALEIVARASATGSPPASR